jgi:hypothetical protein
LTVALAAATQWLFNFVVARSVPVMLVTVGYVSIFLRRFLADSGSANGYGTYLIFCSFAFAMFVFTWFFIPEVKAPARSELIHANRLSQTKGKSLESMDALFGVVPHDEVALERGQLGSVKPIRESLEKDIQVEQVEK